MAWYTHGGYPAVGAPGASAGLRAELDAIAAAFALLPAFTAGTAVVVNGGGTALTNTVGTLALPFAFATAGAGITLTATGTTNVTLPTTGTLATLAGVESLSNKTLVAPALGTPVSGVATNLTGTAAGLTAGNVTTNANLTGPITSTGNATAVAAQTGTGTTFVMQASPTLTTPVLGVASATSINKVTFTAPATGATLTLADGKTVTHNATTTFAGTDGKTLTVSNSLTLAGTDGTVMTFPSTSATVARTDAANTFIGHQTIEGVTTTGATGTGNLVFSAAPTLTGHPTIEGVTSTGATGTGNLVFSAAPTITGHPTVEGVTSTGATGTGNLVFNASPTFTGTLTAATLVATTVNGNSITTGTFTITLTGFSGSVTGTASYSITNGVVTLNIPILTGTSNATTMTATGLPAAITPVTIHPGFAVGIEDNTANPTTSGRCDVHTDNTLFFFKDFSGAAFTASGTKGLLLGATITYNLN